MPSDRARDSYDPSRRYRSVVAQQGRVTLEADINEAQRIAAENLRAETLDVVGPCGTPDDGFAVHGGHPPNIVVGPGTMYVGGERVTLSAPVDYAHQSEWLDRAGDPLWIDPKDVSHGQPEFIYLFLREQEVGAVEDLPLREAALGGPDTGQRTRLIQRFVRTPVAVDRCEPALRAVEQKWLDLGLRFDRNTMTLGSPATLQVKFVQQPVAETPCDPQVQGGYLGADNQLIRVQITGYDASTKQGRFAWSYNNASFLHRVAWVDAQTLELIAAPVDAYHAPRANRAVEVLRGAVDLGAGNYIAAHSGIVATPIQAYAPETRRLVLPAALPDEYRNEAEPLFLRLWEAEVPFVPGQPADLAGTGLQVILDWNGSFGALTVGQFWTFAVRPSQPVNVYPQRYLDAPQPTEGPRMWACPLATIRWHGDRFSILADCREKFDDLVALTKRRTECCSVVVEPEDVDGGAGLADLIESLRGRRATVSLRPGRYELPDPLTLAKDHDGLTLEGCQDGAELAVKAGHEAGFVDGLIALDAVTGVTLRRLRFQLPPVRVRDGYVSFGMRAVGCADLTVEECLFRFDPASGANVRAAAIWVTGDCTNLRVARSRFLYDGQYDPDGPLLRLLVGFTAAPTLPDPGSNPGHRTSAFIPVLLENASIAGNEFAGLTMAVYVRAEFDRLRCENNFAHGCDGGFYFANTDVQILREVLLDASGQESTKARQADTGPLLYTSQAPMVAEMQGFAENAPLRIGAHVPATLTVGHARAATTNKIKAAAKLFNAQRRAAVAPTDGQEAGREPSAGVPQPVAANLSADQIRQLTKSFPASPAAGVQPARHVPVLSFAGNDVGIRPTTASRVQSNKYVGVGLWVVLDPDLDASMKVMANDLRGDRPGAIAIVLRPKTAVVTGNLVLNSQKGNNERSLYIQLDEKDGLMNVSGNVFFGRCLISPPPIKAGSTAGKWSDLNSVKF